MEVVIAKTKNMSINKKCALPKIALKKIATRKYGLHCVPVDEALFQKFYINSLYEDFACTTKFNIKENCLDVLKCDKRVSGQCSIDYEVLWLANNFNVGQYVWFIIEAKDAVEWSISVFPYDNNFIESGSNIVEEVGNGTVTLLGTNLPASGFVFTLTFIEDDCLIKEEYIITRTDIYNKFVQSMQEELENSEKDIITDINKLTIIYNPTENVPLNIRDVEYDMIMDIQTLFPKDTYLIYGEDFMLLSNPRKVAYGNLYNWFAINNASKITSSDTWRVPTLIDIQTLITTFGSALGGKLKAIREIPEEQPRWNIPNIDATDEYNFKAFPGGIRKENGDFVAVGNYCNFWIIDEFDANTSYVFNLSFASGNIVIGTADKKTGNSLRLCRDATVEELELADGSFVENYIGVTNTVYTAIKLGTIIITAENITDQFYRNLTPITQITDNLLWASDNTGARCFYDNNQDDYEFYEIPYGKISVFQILHALTGTYPERKKLTENTYEIFYFSTFVNRDINIAGYMKYFVLWEDVEVEQDAIFGNYILPLRVTESSSSS